MAKTASKKSETPEAPELKVGKGRTAIVVPLKALIDPPQKLIIRDVGDVTSLAADIVRNGQLQSLLVRPARESGKYEILNGRRRFKALRKAGVDTVLVQVATDLEEDKDALAAVYAENAERDNLTPLEQASTYQRMLKQCGDDVKAAARLLNTSTENIRRTVRLLEASEPVKKRLEAGTLTKDAIIAIQSTGDKVRATLEDMAAKGEITTARDAQRAAKELETEAESEATSKSTGSKKESNKTPIRVWMTNREQMEMFDAQLMELLVHNGTVEAFGGILRDKAAIRDIHQRVGTMLVVMGRLPKLNMIGSEKFERILAAELDRVLGENFDTDEADETPSKEGKAAEKKSKPKSGKKSGKGKSKPKSEEAAPDEDTSNTDREPTDTSDNDDGEETDASDDI